MVGNYNERVVQELGKYVEYMVGKLNYSSDEKNYCTLERYEVIESDNLDITQLRVNKSTGSMTVRYFFKSVVNGKVEEYHNDLEVQKMVNNAFVVDGDLRMTSNFLDRDDSCTIYSTNIVINSHMDIRFEPDIAEDGGYKITLNIYDDEDDELSVDGSSENFSKYKERVKLEDFERDKLKVKLDTDDIGEYLTRDIVLKMINKGPDKKFDNMIDKKIWSPESNFIHYMYSKEVRPKITKDIRKKYYQYKRVYLRGIQTAMNNYFKLANEKGIDIPTTVNPIVFDALKFKVMIPKNVAYNDSMSDIIDIVNTPINGNTNKINELNKCVKIKDDVIYIDCYTYPDQTPVSIPYTKYCTKKVLINQFWDYDKKKFVDGTSGIKYKLRMKYYNGKTTDQFDFIEPKADDKLSYTTRRIPIINGSDSIRISMGSTMNKQSVELNYGEPNLVSSGHDNEDFEDSTLVSRHSGEPVTVAAIKENKIYMRTGKGSIYFVDIPDPTIGVNDSIISYDSTVKVGQVVNDGDVIVAPKVLKNRSFDMGINSRVIYMNYLGYTHEDGIVISESYARKLMHFSILNVVKPIYADDIIRFIRKKGSAVSSKDIIVNDQTRLRVNPNLAQNFTGNSGLLRGLGISYNQSNLLVPNNVDEGYLLDVRIELREDAKLTNKDTIKVLSEYPNESASDDYDWIPQKYKDLKADESEIEGKEAGYISAKILRINKAKLGDKLVNNYGSKGVVSLILPDECFPQIESPDGKRIPGEIILNPAAVISRKNISQVYEVSLSKCIEKIYRKVGDKLESGRVKEAKSFTEEFYGDKFTSMSDDEFTEYYKSKGLIGFQMEVGCYLKIPYETIVQWMKDLEVKDTDVIFCPDVVITETKEGTKGFPLKGYVRKEGEKPKLYELGYVEGETVTGLSYIKKLSHSADYTGKVTSSLEEKDGAIFGRGRYREGGGQNIGEMELWILLETGTEKFLQAQAKNSLMTSSYQFIINLLTGGFTMEDPDGLPILSQYHTRSRAMKDLEERTR